MILIIIIISFIIFYNNYCPFYCKKGTCIKNSCVCNGNYTGIDCNIKGEEVIHVPVSNPIVPVTNQDIIKPPVTSQDIIKPPVLNNFTLTENVYGIHNKFYPNDPKWIPLKEKLNGLEVDSIEECSTECLRFPECILFNIMPNTIPNKYKCFLSNMPSTNTTPVKNGYMYVKKIV